MTFREWAEQVATIEAELLGGSDGVEGIIGNKYWERVYHEGTSPMQAVGDNIEWAISVSEVVWNEVKAKLGVKPNGYLPTSTERGKEW